MFDHIRQRGALFLVGFLSAVFFSGCKSEHCPSRSGQFKALTYNVHGLPDVITGDDTADRISQIAPHLKDYNFIALQEDFDDENHDVLVEESDYEEVRRFSETNVSSYYGSGLSFFSAYHIDTYEEYFFDACHGLFDSSSDCLAAKGFQRLRLDLADACYLDVYNSHFEAGGGAEDLAVRQIHVNAVKDAMLKNSSEQAILFLGDTNLHGDDPVETKMLTDWMSALGLKETCDVLDCPEPGRIDRFLFRSGKCVKLQAKVWQKEEQFVDKDGTPLSDHDALSATYSWSTK